MADAAKSIFLAALEKTAAERSTFLDSSCKGDVELRRRVEALLQAAEAVDPLLDRSAAWHLNLPTPEQAEPTRAGRFHLLGEIARGGMGAVLRAHDPELDRALAVKVVLPQHRDHPALVQRFLGEARLAGQLQHPGIVPVYDLGRLDDGRPYFAMKLIEGRTLAQLLQERPAPDHDLPRFLRYFEAVCQVVGYAHARGVLHRDLKPANIMVGAFGEVQVMDWGLARRLDERTTETASQSPATDGQTGAGVVIGTPGYMAPEQARGEVLSARSDVFALGAMLCEVLTGSPPFAEDGPTPLLDVLSRTRQADLSGACDRLAHCGADAELIALARECLSPQPPGRPTDGGAVAERVAAHLAGLQERLRQAELGKARADARAEGERGRRRLTVGLAVAVLALAVLGAGTGLLVQKRHAEQASREQAAELTLSRAAELRARGRWPEALTVLEQARQHLAHDEALTHRVSQAVAELELIGRLEAIRLRAATWTGRSFGGEQADREYEAEFRAAGLGTPDEDVENVASRIRASAVRLALVAILDDWAARAVNRARWARAVAAAADSDDWGRRLRTEWQDVESLRRLARAAPLSSLSPHLLGILGWNLGGGESVTWLRAAQQRHPADFWVNFLLAKRLMDERQPAQAEAFYRAALALRPDTTAVLVNLGAAVGAQGRRDEAAECYRQALALDGRFAYAHSNLGTVLNEKNDLSGAEQCFRTAVEIEPAYRTAHLNLGMVLHRQGRLPEARASLRRAIDLGEQSDFVWRQLGQVHQSQGETAQAIDCLRKAVELAPDAADLRHTLGVLLSAHGKPGEALASYRKAIELDGRLAPAHVNLAALLLAQGQRAEAIGHLRQALAVNPRLAEAHANLGSALAMQGMLDDAITHFRTLVELRPRDADAHYNLGTALSSRQDWDAAVGCFRQALEFNPQKAEAHCNLGLALLQRGDFAAALAPLQRGHELGHKQPGWSYPSPAWLKECARLIGREQALLDVLTGKAKPANVQERLEWATFAMQTRRHDAATRLYREAFAAEPKLAEDVRTGLRARAATAAILAGTGQDRTELSAAQKSALRRQALDWLKTDLAARANQPAAERVPMLRLWLAEHALAGVRTPEALRALPEAERIPWGVFWCEVRKQLCEVDGP